MTIASAFRRAGKKAWIPALLFALSVVLTVFVTWQTSLYCLDSDASSELVLAQHLNETGRLLSADWYYSTELRVLNTQLVFAPLFSVFSDWTMVRFTGALIMQAILILSFFYLGKQAKLSWGARFLGGALLLLPVCVAYGRFILYQSYYIPHIAIGFTIVALFLSSLHNHTAKNRKKALLDLLLLLILSFFSGLGGIRQGVVTHIPLVFLCVILFFQFSKGQPLLPVFKAHKYCITLAISSAASFVLGFLINNQYLSSIFSFGDYSTFSLDILDFTKVFDLLFGVLQFFGFRENIRVLSALGILSIGSVFVFFFCIVQGIFLLLREKHSSNRAGRFVGLFSLSALFIMLCVFLLVDSGWNYALYLLPSITWFLPLIAVLYDETIVRSKVFSANSAGLLLCVLLLFSNGLVNSIYYATNGERFPQRFVGAGYEDIALVRKLEKPVAFLEENGYELGYGEFWTAVPVTEMTDGKIKMIYLLINLSEQPLATKNWLMLKSTFDMQTDKTFLLLTSYYNRAYMAMDIPNHGELVYDDGEFVIYHFDDPSVLKNHIY